VISIELRSAALILLSTREHASLNVWSSAEFRKYQAGLPLAFFRVENQVTLETRNAGWPDMQQALLAAKWLSLFVRYRSPRDSQCATEQAAVLSQRKQRQTSAFEMQRAPTWKSCAT
jgi:hypothetical protein